MPVKLPRLTLSLALLFAEFGYPAPFGEFLRSLDLDVVAVVRLEPEQDDRRAHRRELLEDEARFAAAAAAAAASTSTTAGSAAAPTT